MSDRDWAVIVGINRYPALGDLAGPENDSRAFADWVSSPTGGAVPREHVQLVVSSDFPVAPSADLARPNAADVERPFDRLHEMASRNSGVGMDIAREPDVSYSSGDGRDFVLLELPLAAIPRSVVNLKLSPGSLGQPIEILSARLEVVASFPAAESQEMRFELPRGVYLARAGRVGRQMFELSGAGDVDAAL